jgi:uncharacterized protein
MTFEERITEDMKLAMKAKDKQALEALRAIRAAILLAKTDAGSEGFKDEDSLTLLQKLRKQRVDAAEIFRKQNRADLAEVEESQTAIIERYLPERMSAEALADQIAAIVKELGATGMGDMGRVMGKASSELAGKADGKDIANAVRAALS